MAEVTRIELVFKNGGDIDFRMTPSEDAPPTLESVKTAQIAQFAYHMIGDMIQGDAFKGIYKLIEVASELALNQQFED